MTNRDEKIAKILFVSIFVAILVALILIVLVWANFAKIRANAGKEIITDDLNIGYFSKKTYSREDNIKKYISKLNIYFNNADIDSLYELLSDDYKNYYSYTKEQFFSNLKGKNVFGHNFNSQNYVYSTIDDKKIYKIVLNSEDMTTSLELNIIESSPNNFKFSLDNFIMKNDEVREQVINGVKLRIKEVIYYNDRIVTNATLVNSNDYSILVNNKPSAEAIYYRVANADYLTEAAVFNGESKIINSNSELELQFDVRMSFTLFNKIKSLVIKDVKLTPNSSIIELEYDF